MWAQGFGGWGKGVGVGGLDGFKTNGFWGGFRIQRFGVYGWFRGHGAVFRVVA